MKAYVFDLDGTLVNSLFDIADSINHILKSRGLPEHSYDAIKAMIGDGIYKLLGRAYPGFSDFSQEQQRAVKNEYTAHNLAHILDKTRPYQGLEEVLYTLKDRGAVLGIFTNKPEILGNQIAKDLFREGTFAFILGGKDGAAMKPNPERVLTELARLEIPPEETLFIGDSGVDMETAKNGKMGACGVLWGFRGREELVPAGADWLIAKPAELLDIH